MTKKLLEYVGSGTGFIYLPHSYFLRNQKMIDMVGNMILGISKDTKYHDMSLLYNAYVEKRIGYALKKHMVKYCKHIHSDSGGLQIITRGLPITDALREKIYDNQSKNSHIAMSFDEIPIQFPTESTARLDTKGRWFNQDILEGCAKKTGQNLNAQIEFFKKNKKNIARPLLIIQGNDYDTYMKWCELAIGEVEKENRDFIKGIAIGSAALGMGELEDIRKTFYYSQLPWKPKEEFLHLLGVGGLGRMVPVLMFMRSGLYKDVHISYDSTTHTSATAFGNYIAKDGSRIKFTREYTVEYDKMREEIIERFPWFDFSPQKFFETLQLSVIDYDKKYKDDESVIITVNALVFTSIINFMYSVENVIDNGNLEKKHHFDGLESIKTKKEYDEWEADVGSSMKSRPVARSEMATLEGFLS